MRGSSIYSAVLAMLVIGVSAEIIYKKEKRNGWEDIKCQAGYNCPGIWSRHMGNYTEVCLKTGTEWFEINFGFWNVPAKWMKRYIGKTFKYFMLLNKVHLKYPQKTRSIALLTTTRKEEGGIPANYLTGRIFAPEILSGHRLKIPCEPENVHEYPKTEALLCNKTILGNVYMLKRHMTRKCFYGIRRNHDIHHFKGLKNQFKNLQKNLLLEDNDIFHPISVFYPLFDDKTKGMMYFETIDNLEDE